MKRAAWIIVALALAATRPAAAQDYTREELRVPMDAASPRGLEAMLVRPAAGGPWPLALISHGSPPDPLERPKMSPFGIYRQAVELARRGFAALIVMRRGYGDSGGSYAESTCCNPNLYANSFQATSADLRAAIAAMKGRSDVTTQGMIAVGTSAGGLASVALAADAPPGLAAVINFAGGRRWRKPGGEDIRAAATNRIALRFAASDDFGVAEVRILYHRLGSPEQELKVPRLTRRDSDFVGEAELDLSGLKLDEYELVAYHAVSGDKLWSVNLGLGISSPPITYTVDGRQYVTQLVGWGGGGPPQPGPGQGHRASGSGA